MAQLRRDYGEFAARRAEVLAVGPDSAGAFRRFWQENDMPFVGLADREHGVADVYGQQVKLLRLGRMPALFVIDRQGHIRYRHLASSMRDIPANSEVLALLDALNDEKGENAP
jgi:peroxiredoxin Q/BCP